MQGLLQYGNDSRKILLCTRTPEFFCFQIIGHRNKSFQVRECLNLVLMIAKLMNYNRTYTINPRSRRFKFSVRADRFDSINQGCLARIYFPLQFCNLSPHVYQLLFCLGIWRLPHRPYSSILHDLQYFAVISKLVPKIPD